ncbi:unnamed protein product [Adineta ricciae]|uniref:HAT C-terminal dimerisation domain-containing protein n=2 Tax=Adineta ricciae TaxID=249248 RepID=A0A815PHP5_ADIRI|nr:unnamed protein product [Adineta ricciae]
MHSFKSVEHSGLQTLAQTCIDIGARCGKVDVRDIWYGRKSIRDECDKKFNMYKNQILKEIQKYAIERTLSATTDLWRDDAVGRYYLDFTVFWIDDSWRQHHALLRCKHFEEQSKTAINLWAEIESIFNEFNLIVGDTPITTDEGANIKASLKNEIRLPCMAHRSSTTLETAWEATRIVCPEFDQLITYVSELRAFIARSGNIQTRLPMTIKRNSATRPWRSYYIVYHSVLISYDKLIDVLSPMYEESRILAINKNLLLNVVELMKGFVPIFNSLEFSTTPTIHIVVPSYYAMLAMAQLNGQERPAIKALKENLQTALNEKYNQSIMQIHWIATFLDPSFRELSFVSDKSYRTTQLKSIKDGLILMANDIENEKKDLIDNSTDQQPPLKKARTEVSIDPFAQLRSSSSEPSKLNIKDELSAELAQYSKLSFSTTSTSANPSLLLLDFWRTNEKRLRLLAIIAKRILVIQGSSSESERHFSAGGVIVSEKRSRASASTVESLVVLRECYINGQWPDCSSEDDKEKSGSQNNSTTLTPDIVSL